MRRNVTKTLLKPSLVVMPVGPSGAQLSVLTQCKSLALLNDKMDPPKNDENTQHNVTLLEPTRATCNLRASYFREINVLIERVCWR